MINGKFMQEWCRSIRCKIGDVESHHATQRFTYRMWIKFCIRHRKRRSPWWGLRLL